MPKLIDTGPSEWGWHRLDDARCLHFYAARHVFELPQSQIPSKHLVFGSMLHLVLGHHYKRMQLQAQKKDPEEYYPPEQALEIWSGQLDPEDLVTFNSKFDSAMEMYELYLQRFGRDSRWEVLQVERELRLKVRDPRSGKIYTYTQGEDLRVRDRVTGKIHTVDHKSTYALYPRVTKRLQTDGQFIGYWVFGRLRYGDKFGGPIINFLKKPQGTSSWEFRRSRVPYFPGLTSNFKQLIVHRRQLIAHLEDRDLAAWPREFSQHTCWSAYGECAMARTCQGRTF